MTGYYNQPEATAQAIRGGWLFTGDLARIDEDGYVASSIARRTCSSFGDAMSTRGRWRRCSILTRRWPRRR